MTLAENIVKALGLDPAQLREALGRVVGTAQRVDANMIAAQEAVKQATAHFDARFDALEKMIASLSGYMTPEQRKELENDRSKLNGTDPAAIDAGPVGG